VRSLRGVVLAGGDSTRFGDAEKATATLDGEPLVARVAGAVRDATGRDPVVAVRRDAQAGRLSTVLGSVEFVYDAPGFEGPLAGLLGALDAVETPRLFACGCDMPLLSADAVAWLAETVPVERADALAPAHPDGTPEPMHALYRREAVECARAELPTSGGVHALLDALDAETVPLSAAPEDVGLADSVTNVNTREELAAVRRHYAAA
jgi:molybdopterin-guanine dinucleotide biosynthesis protein A